MRINEREFERVAMQAGVSAEQCRAILDKLQNLDEAEAHFRPSHVAYYFGALLIIGAMGWFMTEGWDNFSGGQLATIAGGYALVLAMAGYHLWRTRLFRIAGGLLVTTAVCMAPLFTYGVERQLNLWPSVNPGSYSHFHPYINASWVGMEMATVVAAMIALWYVRFPFLTAPVAYALWYMSMDVSALLLGRDWLWQEKCTISAAFGAIMLLVSYWLDGKFEQDFSFWGYLFGLMTFTGGLSAMESGSELAKFGYCLTHLALIVISLLLKRRVFLVFGSIGVFGYLSSEAWAHFRNSVGFPFVLSLLGLALIFLAMQYAKKEAVLQQKIASWLTRDVVRLKSKAT